ARQRARTRSHDRAGPPPARRKRGHGRAARAYGPTLLRARRRGARRNGPHRLLLWPDRAGRRRAPPHRRGAPNRGLEPRPGRGAPRYLQGDAALPHREVRPAPLKLGPERVTVLPCKGGQQGNEPPKGALVFIVVFLLVVCLARSLKTAKALGLRLTSVSSAV